jgi:V8-like Glu-specific endopeptidase
VVHIETHFPRQNALSFIQGTGALVDPFHVLTAGHLLYDSSRGGWADQVRVIPGQQGPDDSPYGLAYGTVERTYNPFITNDQAGVYMEQGDLGLVTLDRALGRTTGWFALGFDNDNGYFRGLAVNTAGYPAETGYSGDNMYREYGPLNGATADGQALTWNLSSLTALAGQSGSPLWVYDAATNKRTVYGVVDASSPSAQVGFGSRITAPVFADLQNWAASDALPTSAGSAFAPPVTHAGFDLPPPSAGVGGASSAGGAVAWSTHTTQGEGVGGFDPATATWYLRNEEGGGGADAGTFQFGNPGWVPVTGDWLGTGRTGIGGFDPATATWYLRSSAGQGPPDVGVFQYGAPGWVPVVGDWTGSGHAGIGAFDPATATWYLRNEAGPGAPDAGVFQYGAPGWVPVAGNWDGGAASHVGAFDPATATWYLRNENGGGAPDAGAFAFGAPGWRPVVGRWDGGRAATVGVINPATSTWYLRNVIGNGAPTTPPFAFGGTGWVGVVGAWVGAAESPTSAEFPGPGRQTAGSLPPAPADTTRSPDGPGAEPDRSTAAVPAGAAGPDAAALGLSGDTSAGRAGEGGGAHRQAARPRAAEDVDALFARLGGEGRL